MSAKRNVRPSRVHVLLRPTAVGRRISLNALCCVPQVCVPLLQTPKGTSFVVPNLIYCNCISRFARVGPIRLEGKASAIV
jgi:hypothetical protein